MTALTHHAMTLRELTALESEAAVLDQRIAMLSRTIRELDALDAAYGLRVIVQRVATCGYDSGLGHAQKPLDDALDAIKADVLLVVKLRLQAVISDAQMTAAQKRCAIRAAIVPLPMQGT